MVSKDFHSIVTPHLFNQIFSSNLLLVGWPMGSLLSDGEKYEILRSKLRGGSRETQKDIIFILKPENSRGSNHHQGFLPKNVLSQDVRIQKLKTLICCTCIMIIRLMPTSRFQTSKRNFTTNELN